MKFFILIFMLPALFGCNQSKEGATVSGASTSSSGTSLPLKYQLTEEELSELKSQGLLTESNINEIKKLNK